MRRDLDSPLLSNAYHIRDDIKSSEKISILNQFKRVRERSLFTAGGGVQIGGGKNFSASKLRGGAKF